MSKRKVRGTVCEWNLNSLEKLKEIQEEKA